LMITGALASRMPNKTARLTDIAGAGRKLPMMSALYLIGGLALAGVPPLNGFISKVSIVRGGIDANSWLILGLAVAAGIITLMYTVGTWQHIFQRAPEGELKLKLVGDSLAAPLLLVGLCILLGLYAVPVVEAATIAVSRLNDPNLYIQAVLGG
jgi:multicomponent Na+:H+ antiporter subunit D